METSTGLAPAAIAARCRHRRRVPLAAVEAPAPPFAADEELSRLAEELRRTHHGARERLEAIIDFIFDTKKGLGFQYRRRPTLTAVEALDRSAEYSAAFRSALQDKIGRLLMRSQQP